MARVATGALLLCILAQLGFARASGGLRSTGGEPSGADEFVDMSPVAAEAAPPQVDDAASAADDETSRRLAGATGKPISCVCRVRLGNLRCAGTYFSLMQCSPVCPSACSRMGLTFDSCVGKRQVEWYGRLGYRYSGC
mmetsp:Transcript_80705/g.226416  ORF Transcript_80705/g.226416 Transcript_80705/m.226416 type:complete len:138 (-) Transcript_80705:345-758(-)